MNDALRDERDADVEQAWAAEIKRRIADLDSGAVVTVTWESVRADLLRRIEQR
jgi:putative addiction module component (TIGR02574 family)